MAAVARSLAVTTRRTVAAIVDAEAAPDAQPSSSLLTALRQNACNLGAPQRASVRSCRFTTQLDRSN
jgi:hypothetical protein